MSHKSSTLNPKASENYKEQWKNTKTPSYQEIAWSQLVK